MEIERKFLVVGEQRPLLREGRYIEQGHLVFQNPPDVPVELRLRRVEETDCFLAVRSFRPNLRPVSLYRLPGLAEKSRVIRDIAMLDWPVEPMKGWKAGTVAPANTPNSNGSA